MVKTFDNLPLWAKVILSLPLLNILWVVYRLCKSIKKNNYLGIVLACVLLIFGIPFLWLVDIITLLVYNRVLWID